MKEILQDLSRGELTELVNNLGEKKFRAEQIYLGLMQGKKISELNISPALRAALLERFEDEPVRISETFVSQEDGTKKYVSSAPPRSAGGCATAPRGKFCARSWPSTEARGEP